MKRSIFVLLLVGLLVAGLPSAVSSAQDRPPTTKGARSREEGWQEFPTVPVLPPESPAAGEDVGPSFESFAQDLVDMHFLFEGGDGEPVIFDTGAARAQGYSEQSIRLAEELTAYTNDLTRAAVKTKDPRGASVTKLDVKTSRYPNMTAFFVKGAKHEKEAGSKDDGPSIIAFGLIGIAEYQCGSFLRPLPSRAATAREHYSSNPAQTLASWGYHRTPDYAGGGWTRPRTYKWWLCGWNTFRDDAWTLIRRPNYIQEQNYSGWTPNGEPNPEVWRSGPWPYATWPAYVAFWHKTR